MVNLRRNAGAGGNFGSEAGCRCETPVFEDAGSIPAASTKLRFSAEIHAPMNSLAHHTQKGRIFRAVSRLPRYAWLAVAALAIALPVRAADPADGVTLSVAYNKPTATVTLSWTGSQPDFGVFRSSTPPAITAPASAVGVTSSRSWPDPAPGTVAYYRVTSAQGTVTAGASDRLLLRGTVVAPSGFFEGEVLVEGNLLTCVAPSCAAAPGASGATIVATNGIIMPGLIDAANHVLFNIFDPSDWTPSQVYTNHNQWPIEPRYNQVSDCKQYLNGEGTSPVDVGCEMEKYGEIKALIAGTTSMVAAAGSRSCYASIIRTVDTLQNDLGADKIQTSTFLPTSTAAQAICDNFAAGTTNAYLLTLADGTDATALNEFATLQGRAGGCLMSSKTTIVYGTALGANEFATMASHGMKLVWSPRSNIRFYGATTNIPLARSAGIKIALAPDWSLGGSQNVLDELRFADAIDNAQFGNILTDEQLFKMVTIDAAGVLALDGVLGSLEVGKRADIAVITGDRAAPYRALLAAGPASVRLTLVDGRALYGDLNLAGMGAPGNTCEAAALCGADKFLCVAEAGTANLLNQGYETIRQNLVGALSNYDAMVAPMGIAPFSPLTPVSSCP